MTKKVKKRKYIKPILCCAVGVAKLAVIPHKGNDYRPHIIRRYGLILLILVSMGLFLNSNNSINSDVLGNQSDVTISSLLNQTNQARSQAGKAPLLLNDKLNQAAYLKATDMFANQYWAHNAPDGTQPWKWFGDVGYNYNEAGENLAKNFLSTSTVMSAWMASPEHKMNILNDHYADVGFAVVSGKLDNEPTLLVVALYGLAASNDVAGVQRSFAAVETKLSLLSQIGVLIQSASPALLGALTLISMAAMAASLAHLNRKKLPKKLRQSWYRHHGLYKGIGLIAFGLLLIIMSGGGQLL